MKFLRSALGFVGGNWLPIVLVAAAAYIGFLHLRIADEKLYSAKLQNSLRECNAENARLESETRAKTELAHARDAADSAKTQARDLKRAMELNDALRKDTATMRARLAEWMRAGAPTADSSGGGNSSMPPSSSGTPRLAGAGGGAFIPTDDLRICAENTLKAKAAREFLMGRPQ